uniref:Integrase catalytic domain-containing protein n=1 Tax=Chara braunii TaxID=69332 RepID=A0A388MCA2_CHABU
MPAGQATEQQPRRSKRIADRQQQPQPAVRQQPQTSTQMANTPNSGTSSEASTSSNAEPLPICPAQGPNESIGDYIQRVQTYTAALTLAKERQDAAEADRQRLAAEAAAQAQQQAEAAQLATDKLNADSAELLISPQDQWTAVLNGMRYVPVAGAEPAAVQQERQNLADILLNTMRAVIWNSTMGELHSRSTRQLQHDLSHNVKTLAAAVKIVDSQLKQMDTRIAALEARTSQAAPGCTTDTAKQLNERIDHVVTLIGDLSDFTSPAMISSTVAAIKTDITKLQSQPAAAAKVYKMPRFNIVATPHTSIACHVVSVARIRDAIAQNDVEEMGLVFLHALPLPDGPAASPPAPRISHLLDEYGDVFEAPTGTVPDRPIRHGITPAVGVVPPRGCIYRMSEEELEVLRAQLGDLLDKGWIRPSCSPYGAPVLFVRKKKKDLRLCIDYRKLNAQTVKNADPLPRIDDLLERLGGATYFSKSDLKSGYHQIEIQPQDRYKTALKTRYGHFEWVVMPFGLTNAPATFQAAMTTEFRDLLDHSVLIYLDDILVYSRTLDEHIVHLHAVLDRLRPAKYKANLDKCEFAKQELEYLGHYVTPKVIRPLADKIQAIVDWPEPRCTTDVRSFMGLAGYYQRFVESYSKVAAPLSRLQSPKVPFEFDDATPPELARLLHTGWITNQGVPEDIVSDRDTRFMSAFWTSLMAESGTTIKSSSARHPQTDGQTERAHQTAQMMLRTPIRLDQKDWVDRLPDIEFAYNTSVHPAICVTPFELHHCGEKARIFADLLLPRAADIDVPCSPASVRKYRDLLIKARANMQKAQIRMQQQANRRRLPCPFREGDLVWVLSEEFALEQDVSRKLLPKWFGPWEITFAVGDDPAGPSFVVNMPPHLTVHRVFHASKLAIYTPPSADEFPARRSQDPPSMDGHQEVDRVLTHRKYGNKPRQYKVTFKQCAPDDTQWIARADLQTSAPLIFADYEKRRLAKEAVRPARPAPVSDRQLRPRR